MKRIDLYTSENIKDEGGWGVKAARVLLEKLRKTFIKTSLVVSSQVFSPLCTELVLNSE